MKPFSGFPSQDYARDAAYHPVSRPLCILAYNLSPGSKSLTGNAVPFGPAGCTSGICRFMRIHPFSVCCICRFTTASEPGSIALQGGDQRFSRPPLPSLRRSVSCSRYSAGHQGLHPSSLQSYSPGLQSVKEPDGCRNNPSDYIGRPCSFCFRFC